MKRNILNGVYNGPRPMNLYIQQTRLFIKTLIEMQILCGIASAVRNLSRRSHTSAFGMVVSNQSGVEHTTRYLAQNMEFRVTLEVPRDASLADFEIRRDQVIEYISGGAGGTLNPHLGSLMVLQRRHHWTKGGDPLSQGYGRAALAAALGAVQSAPVAGELSVHLVLAALAAALCHVGAPGAGESCNHLLPHAGCMCLLAGTAKGMGLH